MIKFQKSYFIIAVSLFVTEVLIALYLHDEIIRPYFGDVLVVILLYCFVKSFLNIPVAIAAFSVLLFSYLIETLQYFHIIHYLGLDRSALASTIMGNYFTWVDILAYTLGISIVLCIEWLMVTGKKLRSLTNTRQ